MREKVLPYVIEVLGANSQLGYGIHGNLDITSC